MNDVDKKTKNIQAHKYFVVFFTLEASNLEFKSFGIIVFYA